MRNSLEVSHGRGGVGNIVADDTPYGDGEVVRAGVEGSHADGAFSTGRGGTGNIGDAGVTAGARSDKEVVPEAAVRPSADLSDYHTGRGGAGNAHMAKQLQEEAKAAAEAETPAEAPAPISAPSSTSAPTSGPVGLADKLKYKIFGAFKK